MDPSSGISPPEGNANPVEEVFRGFGEPDLRGRYEVADVPMGLVRSVIIIACTSKKCLATSGHEVVK